MKIKIYIASPYTKGDVAINVKTSIDMYNILLKKGFAPFCPLYSHFQHMFHPQSWETWMELDLEWVAVCDCLLRLPGESKGADIEIEFAKKNNIPVFYDLKSLYKWTKKKTRI